MKGLLIKDFALLKNQKIFFLIILVQGVAFFGFGERGNISFAASFMTLIMCFFTVTTISYDEYNHGNTFLFSLPFSRKPTRQKNMYLPFSWAAEPGLWPASFLPWPFTSGSRKPSLSRSFP